ncbi:MAG: bifunctional folylpolyglutamate synthase/dihydrofolate synthase [Bacteroidales bacterium]|nr:bifunctional folylpolyglutamate synthase/dihydrofolate synthase [Bacteroidales bacterium]MCQ2292298.1 bifunctional folylpolyglutamate synthase/dihydrofolate synthase [Bacteroidales bacterium]
MYQALLEEIFHAYPMYHKVGSSAYKEGLENIEALLKIVGNPEKKLKAIHIAGTNGKGSVAHLMSSYCQERHLKTGLFTSPHLVDFRERIRIDGEMVSEEQILEFFKLYKPQIDELQPSFFEITTALAFWHFATQKVDIAVIEVGLGGRLDATNVIRPLLSIITNITLEHTHLLGDSIAKIAMEKGGIIKKETPVIVGEFHPESYPVFTDLADKHNAPLFLAEENYTIEGDLNDCTIYDVMGNVMYEHVNLPLSGEYQRKNLKTVLQAIDVLEELLPYDKDVTVAAIENVIQNTGFTGRWQILRQEPLTICDVGHNVGGLTLTMKQLSALPCRKLRMVFGMVADKDIDNILPLLPKDAKYYVCQANIERALSCEELTTKLRCYNLDATEVGTVEQAIRSANGDAAPDDILFIGGSCFVVGEALGLRQQA